MHPITIEALELFPQQLQAHYEAFPAERRHWAPASWAGVPSEPFTAIEQICHVRDIEVEGYHVRFRRLLTESSPVLQSLDGEAMARERAYANAQADEVFASFAQARKETVALIRRLQATQWDRVGHLDGYGPLTVRSLVHYLCSHDQQHVAGLQWLLGKISAP